MKLIVIRAGVLLGEALRQRLEQGGCEVVLNAEPPEDRTLTLAERFGTVTLPEMQVTRPEPPPPPWINSQPWLKRKKKGRS